MGFLKTVKGSFFNLQIIDGACLQYSKWKLRRRIQNESSLDDILDTTGTWEDPHGAFKGMGNYRTIQILQPRDEIYSVAEHIRSHAPSTILEIGAGWGGTLYVWSRLIESANTIISIDIDYRGKIPLIKSLGDLTDKDIICIEGSSHNNQVKDKTEHLTRDKNIDFLYIDGDHSYESVKKDFDTYSSMVADGGIIGLHDVENHKTEVPIFWRELEEEYDCRKIDKGAGTGLVYV